jgi:DNA-binding HxlR family transcriptional regulator
MEARKELLEIKCPVGITQNVIEGKWKLVIINSHVQLLHSSLVAIVVSNSYALLEPAQ